ncbi:MAG: S46 family peptidase [Bacteroidia bacterium]|nr:S46 family peptidase [Bacteroidia bacterium]
MKKILAALAAIIILTPAAKADEGMWMLPLLEKINADAIRNLGGRLTPEQIYSVNHSSIKDAVVQFGGGCTGEIISAEGLLVTNHHCGYSSIQGLSTPEHNYLEDGYFAKSRAEELPVPGLTVRFLQSMTDVTEQTETEDARNAVIDAAKAENPNCEIRVTSFFNDNVRYLIVSKVYRDVRFVGAPPASSGKFGGDTDNWMWPRHTCDFSMFRVYAGKDNEPADFSEENVPMQPRQFLNVSIKGVKEGDFAMIMGYPGRTQRYQTAAQLEDMLQANDIRIDARTVRQDVLWKEMRADDEVGLKYANKYASSSNGWKKWQGERDAFAKLGVLDRQKNKEADLNKWISADKKRAKKYGDPVGDIAKIVDSQKAAYQAYLLATETIGNIELLSLARAKNDNGYKNYDENVDKKVALAVVEHYLKNVKPEDKIEISADAVESMFANSAFTSLKRKQAAIAAGIDLSADPAVLLANKLIEKLEEMVKPLMGDEMDAPAKSYAAALLEWNKGADFYPDANSTCRLTYGTVKGYEPKDGVVYKYYTTLKGVLEKEDPGNYEFRVPAKLKEIILNKDYGQYANENGEMVACFLTNLDITGGNSGSPVLDADGNLIGLAFDGNWEAMSGDVIFEPELQRCICVDIRYVLLMMDKFGGAGYLLNEMNIVR